MLSNFYLLQPLNWEKIGNFQHFIIFYMTYLIPKITLYPSFFVTYIPGIYLSSLFLSISMPPFSSIVIFNFILHSVFQVLKQLGNFLFQLNSPPEQLSLCNRYCDLLFVHSKMIFTLVT